MELYQYLILTTYGDVGTVPTIYINVSEYSWINFSAKLEEEQDYGKFVATFIITGPLFPVPPETADNRGMIV